MAPKTGWEKGALNVIPSTFKLSKWSLSLACSYHNSLFINATCPLRLTFVYLITMKCSPSCYSVPLRCKYCHLSRTSSICFLNSPWPCIEQLDTVTQPTNAGKCIKVSSYQHSFPPTCTEWFTDPVTLIFGPKRDEVTREWRKLHNEKLNDLYCSSTIVRMIKSRRMRWVRHVARMGERTGLYRILVGKPEGKRPLGRPRRRWEDNIKMDLQEVGCGVTDWMVAGTCECGIEPSGSIKCGEFLD